MRFGKWRAAVAAVDMVCGAMVLVSFVSAQTLDRDFPYDVFRALGAGSEIGVSVRELSDDEVSKALRHFVRLVSESPVGRSVRIETIRESARHQNCC